MITCTVGKLYENTFTVSEDLLRQSSDVIGSKIRDATRQLALRDVSAEIFRHYVEWLGNSVIKLEADGATSFHPSHKFHLPLYDEGTDRFSCPNPECFFSLTDEPAGKLGLIWSEGPSSPNPSSAGKAQLHCKCGISSTIEPRLGRRKSRANELQLREWDDFFTKDMDLYNLYNFAVEYKIAGLQNQVLTTWINQDNERQCLPDFHIIKLAFENFPPDSALCRYFVDVSMYYWMPDCRDEQEFLQMSRMPETFSYVLLMGAMQPRGEKKETTPYMPDVCKYHIHADEADIANCRAERRSQSKVIDAKRPVYRGLSVRGKGKLPGPTNELLFGYTPHAAPRYLGVSSPSGDSNDEIKSQVAPKQTGEFWARKLGFGKKKKTGLGSSGPEGVECVCDHIGCCAEYKQKKKEDKKKDAKDQTDGADDSDKSHKSKPNSGGNDDDLNGDGGDGDTFLPMDATAKATTPAEAPAEAPPPFQNTNGWGPHWEPELNGLHPSDRRKSDPNNSSVPPSPAQVKKEDVNPNEGRRRHRSHSEIHDAVKLDEDLNPALRTQRNSAAVAENDRVVLTTLSCDERGTEPFPPFITHGLLEESRSAELGPAIGGPAIGDLVKERGKEKKKWYNTLSLTKKDRDARKRKKQKELEEEAQEDVQNDKKMSGARNGAKKKDDSSDTPPGAAGGALFSPRNSAVVGAD